MRIELDPQSIESYRQFLAIKSLPSYRFIGRSAIFPDCYAKRLGLEIPAPSSADYTPISGLFDYQLAIIKVAIDKHKYCVFADCGLGKTIIITEFARYVQSVLPNNLCILIISPLMVVPQTLREVERFYQDTLPIEHVRSSNLSNWLNGERQHRIGIVNYDALKTDIRPGDLGSLILDESSMLKSHYGKFGTKCLDLGRGLDYKLACTGTPAPNDRIEFANHAVFMDAFPTVNSFLARFFVNRGQTSERWEIKPHAIKPFYRALSDWSIFLTNPAVYGWHDNTNNIPPINVHVEDVAMTVEQRTIMQDHSGHLFTPSSGGITNRSKFSQLGKGFHKGTKIKTNKIDHIIALLTSWPNESTIIWCLYNAEQERLAKALPEAESITGSTPIDKRIESIERFKSGQTKTLISKPKILGFGLNLQIATRQIFSGLQDSYESFYQAVKRSNRYGSTLPLNVHIPVTDLEKPMIETVLRKAQRVIADTEEQERIFKDASEYHNA